MESNALGRQCEVYVEENIFICTRFFWTLLAQDRPFFISRYNIV